MKSSSGRENRDPTLVRVPDMNQPISAPHGRAHCAKLTRPLPAAADAYEMLSAFIEETELVVQRVRDDDTPIARLRDADHTTEAVRSRTRGATDSEERRVRKYPGRNILSLRCQKPRHRNRRNRQDDDPPPRFRFARSSSVASSHPQCRCAPRSRDYVHVPSHHSVPDVHAPRIHFIVRPAIHVGILLVARSTRRQTDF